MEAGGIPPGSQSDGIIEHPASGGGLEGEERMQGRRKGIHLSRPYPPLLPSAQRRGSGYFHRDQILIFVRPSVALVIRGFYL